MTRNSPMKNITPPGRCLLCNAVGVVSSARFHQVYPQEGSSPILLDWWECSVCRGWFVHPVPSVEAIQKNWGTVVYNDAGHESQIFRWKEPLLRRILAELSRHIEPGRLLDFGSNYGRFLALAQECGWKAYGFEPCQEAAELSCRQGFDVRTGWSLDEVRLPEGYFDAITAIDSFCFPKDPIATLISFHRLLRPGGALAMRVSNKRTLLGLVRRLTREGPARDAKLSRILQAQFHTISVVKLKRVLKSIGFDEIRVIHRATVAPWRSLSLRTKLAYSIADVLYYLTLTKINVSPGVVVLARKVGS